MSISILNTIGNMEILEKKFATNLLKCSIVYIFSENTYDFRELTKTALILPILEDKKNSIEKSHKMETSKYPN